MAKVQEPPPAAKARKPREITGGKVFAAFIAFFGVVIGVNMVMARYAVTTFAGVETESSYRAGLAFKGEEDKAAAQDARHWQVDVKIETLPDGQRQLEARARDAAGRPLNALGARAMLARPTDARKDVVSELQPLGEGLYRARTMVAEPGQWTLILDFSQGGERLFRSKNRVQLP